MNQARRLRGSTTPTSLFRYSKSFTTAAADAGHAPDDANASNTRLLIGRCLVALGRRSEAEDMLLRAERGLVQTLGEDARPVREARTHLLQLATAIGDSEATAHWQALLDAGS